MQIQMIQGAARAAIALLCLSAPALAQFNTGSITGVVRDQSGAVVPNASVRIINAGTNEERTMQTDANGRYEAPVLPTGRYHIEASAPGFKTQQISNVNLAVGEKARLDLELPVGEIGEVVTIASQTRTEVETSAIGDTIGVARVGNLPVNGRDFTLLLATVPGSVQSSNFFQTSINGVPTWFGQSVLVDGVDAGRGDLNGVSNVLGRIDARVNRISMDSIQEVQVLEQTYAAQYGQAIGSIINPVTKSGTNDFHGGLFEYFRNDRLDANDFFANARNVGKQKLRLNQFGGNLSGPILRNRLFFFTNYEGVRQRKGTILQGLVPTPAFRATFKPELEPVLRKLPLPNTSFASADPRLGLYSKIGNRELREDTGSVKFDYNAGTRDQFAVRYNINDSDTITPYGIAEGQIAPGWLRVQLFKATHTHTFASNAINEFAVGVNRNVTYPQGGDMSLPIFNFAFVDNAIAGPGPALFSQFRASTTLQFLDTLSYVRGDHSFKFGADIRVNRRAARVDRQVQLIFFSVQDFANNAPFIAQRLSHPTLGYRNENFSFFIQDDWKAHPRLTLNLGLRYDASTPSREQYGRLQNFDLATRSYTPIGARVHNPDLNNFGPRVGLAWDLFGTQKTVLRAGFGIFYNQELPASFGSPHNDTFPNLTVNVFDAIFGGFPFPFAFPLNDAVFELAPPSSKAINVIDPNLRTPYAEQWSLNIQQDVGIGVLQVGYVGNHVLKLTAGSSITALNINRSDPFTLARPIPSLGDIFIIAGYPQSNYNALQTTFKRRLANGLGFNVNYTWAHQIDDAIGFFKDYQDPNNTRADRAAGDSDIRHNLTFDLTYDVPSLRRIFGSLPRALADGWQLNSITQIRSGFPVNVTVTGGLFGGSLRPNLIPGVPVRPADYRLPERQFNPAAFAAPPPGTFGSLGRNALRGPGFSQVDFSVFKNTRLTETVSLQFRTEIFNIFNHPNFADPFSGLNRDPLSNSLQPTASFGQSFQTVGDQLGGQLGAGGPRQIQFALRLIF
jgi:hypothetical protein